MLQVYRRAQLCTQSNPTHRNLKACGAECQVPSFFPGADLPTPGQLVRKHWHQAVLLRPAQPPPCRAVGLRSICLPRPDHALRPPNAPLFALTQRPLVPMISLLHIRAQDACPVALHAPSCPCSPREHLRSRARPSSSHQPAAHMSLSSAGLPTAVLPSSYAPHFCQPGVPLSCAGTPGCAGLRQGLCQAPRARPYGPSCECLRQQPPQPPRPQPSRRRCCGHCRRPGASAQMRMLRPCDLPTFQDAAC